MRSLNWVMMVCCVSASLVSTAFAACYTVYDPANKVILRSTASPIDLSKSLSAATAERFPGHVIVVSSDSTSCTEIDFRVGASGSRSSNPADLLDAPPSSIVTGSGGGGSSQAGTDVNVRGYYRKDGTYVAPYTRAAPGRGRK